MFIGSRFANKLRMSKMTYMKPVPDIKGCVIFENMTTDCIEELETNQVELYFSKGT